MFSSLNFCSQKRNDKLEIVSMIRIGRHSNYVLRKLVEEMEKNRVKEIDLSSISAITGSTLTRLIGALNQIEVLNLNKCTHVDDSIFNTIYTQRIKILDLESTLISDFGVKTLSYCKYLSVLNLSNCLNVTNKSIEFLSSSITLEDLSIRSCPNITSEGFDIFQAGKKKKRVILSLFIF